MVVAHLVEQLLPTPEFCGSNPVIGKNLYWTFVYCQLFIEKTKIKKKMPGMAHFLKRVIPQRVDIHVLSRAIILYLCPTTNPIEQLTSLEGFYVYPNVSTHDVWSLTHVSNQFTARHHLVDWCDAKYLSAIIFDVAASVTRLGDLLDFGQLFKTCGNN